MTGLVDTRPARLRHPAVLAFGAWNALVWLGRIRNIVNDDALSGSSRVLWMVPAVVFGLGGVAALVGWWRPSRPLVAVVSVVALAALLYWPVRTLVMLFAGHTASFVVVHLVLAVVSVPLAAAVLVRLGGTRRRVRRGPMVGASDR